MPGCGVAPHGLRDLWIEHGFTGLYRGAIASLCVRNSQNAWYFFARTNHDTRCYLSLDQFFLCFGPSNVV